jgi:hypothetical protein
MPVLPRSDHNEHWMKSSGNLYASPTVDVSSDKVMEWVTKSFAKAIHTCEAAFLICRSSACNAEKNHTYVNKTREHALRNARNASALRVQDGKFHRAYQKSAEPITFCRNY